VRPATPPPHSPWRQRGGRGHRPDDLTSSNLISAIGAAGVTPGTGAAAIARERVAGAGRVDHFHRVARQVDDAAVMRHEAAVPAGPQHDLPRPGFPSGGEDRGRLVHAEQRTGLVAAEDQDLGVREHLPQAFDLLLDRPQRGPQVGVEGERDAGVPRPLARAVTAASGSAPSDTVMPDTTTVRGRAAKTRGVDLAERRGGGSGTVVVDPPLAVGQRLAQEQPGGSARVDPYQRGVHPQVVCVRTHPASEGVVSDP
jgi:hypothetical protein